MKKIFMMMAVSVLFAIILFSCEKDYQLTQNNKNENNVQLNVNHPNYTRDSSIADTMVRAAIGHLLTHNLDTVHQVLYHSVLTDSSGKLFYYMEYKNLSLTNKTVLIEVYDPGVPQGLSNQKICEGKDCYTCKDCTNGGSNCIFTSIKSGGLIESVECTGCNGSGCPMEKSTKTSLNDFNVGTAYATNLTIPTFIFNSNIVILD